MLRPACRAGGGGHIGDIDEVLEPDGNAVQRAAILAGRQFGIGEPSRIERFVREHAVEGEIDGVARRDAGEDAAHQLQRSERAVAQPAAGFGDGQIGQPLIGVGVAGQCLGQIGNAGAEP